MIISAREAQRLTKTRWLAELQEIEREIKNAIYSNRYEVEYIGKLCDETVDYLKGIGYNINRVDRNHIIINWKE